MEREGYLRQPVKQESPQNEKTELRLEGISGIICWAQNTKRAERLSQWRYNESLLDPKSLLLALAVKGRIAEKANSLSLCYTPGKDDLKTKEAVGWNGSCGIPHCQGSTPRLLLNGVMVCSWSLKETRQKTSYLISTWKVMKIGRWVRDDLIETPHKPPTLSHPGKITRHSSKLQISCGSSLCRHNLCRCVQGCQSTMAEPFSSMAEGD